MNLTKFVFNTMKGAPVLASEWGSLLNVLRTILITGFNETIVQNYTQDGDKLTLNFAVEHGFIKDQVITLMESEQEEANVEYAVESVLLKSLVIKLYNPEVLITGAVKCKTSGLGWTEVFTGENKALFQAKNTLNNPFFLRIDNSCPIGYDPTWAKFARVTMCDGMVNIDDFGSYAKGPVYQDLSRDLNELGDKVSGATGIFGIAKWYHGFSLSNGYLTENRTENQSQNLEYELVGDNSSLYFLPRTTTYRDSRALYVFTPYIKLSSLDQYNCFLSAAHHYKKANASGDDHYNSVSNSSGNKWYSLDSTGKYFLSTWNGITNTSPNAIPFSLNPSNSTQYSGRSTNIPFPNPIDNSVILSDIFLKDSTNTCLRGTLPIIKWILNNWTYGNKFIFDKDNNKYIILGNDYLSEGMTSYFAYRLER